MSWSNAARARRWSALAGSISFLPWARETFVDVDAVGSTIVLAVDHRPPLLVSHDGGITWNERGAGLGRARAVAVGENPDDVLLGGRNRLWVSHDGGVFWRSIGVELPEIVDVAWEYSG